MAPNPCDHCIREWGTIACITADEDCDNYDPRHAFSAASPPTAPPQGQPPAPVAYMGGQPQAPVPTAIVTTQTPAPTAVMGTRTHTPAYMPQGPTPKPIFTGGPSNPPPLAGLTDFSTTYGKIVARLAGTEALSKAVFSQGGRETRASKKAASQPVAPPEQPSFGQAGGMSAAGQIQTGSEKSGGAPKQPMTAGGKREKRSTGNYGPSQDPAPRDPTQQTPAWKVALPKTPVMPNMAPQAYQGSNKDTQAQRRFEADRLMREATMHASSLLGSTTPTPSYGQGPSRPTPKRKATSELSQPAGQPVPPAQITGYAPAAMVGSQEFSQEPGGYVDPFSPIDDSRSKIMRRWSPGSKAKAEADFARTERARVRAAAAAAAAPPSTSYGTGFADDHEPMESLPRPPGRRGSLRPRDEHGGAITRPRESSGASESLGQLGGDGGDQGGDGGGSEHYSRRRKPGRSNDNRSNDGRSNNGKQRGNPSRSDTSQSCGPLAKPGRTNTKDSDGSNSGDLLADQMSRSLSLEAVSTSSDSRSGNSRTDSNDSENPKRSAKAGPEKKPTKKGSFAEVSLNNLGT